MKAVTYEDPIAVLPLRGGSRGIPGKNIKCFSGQPLFTWTATAALNAGLKVVVSTDDEDISRLVRELTPSVSVIKRPAKLATDIASTESVVNHVLNTVKANHILLLQATSPLTTSRHIREAIDLYFSCNCRPLVSGTRKHSFFWDNSGNPLNYDPLNRPRRQDWEGTFTENGAFYIFSSDDFRSKYSRCSPPCTLYTMENEHEVELDSIEEWEYLEKKIKDIQE